MSNGFLLLLVPVCPISVGSLIPVYTSVSYPAEYAIYFMLDTWLIYSVICFSEKTLKIHYFLIFISQGQFIYGIVHTLTYLLPCIFTFSRFMFLFFCLPFNKPPKFFLHSHQLTHELTPISFARNSFNNCTLIHPAIHSANIF